MFRFAQPEYLWFLLSVPLIIAVYLLYRYGQKRRLERFGDLRVIEGLMPDASPRRVRNKFVLTVIALIWMILALGQPQFGSKLREVTRKGVEIMLAVDVSNSMLAEDFAPNRLERTKNAVNRLIEQLDKDRVGMVVFAGEAYIQLPITSDYISAKSFVSGLNPNMVPVQGTSLARAIELSVRSFSEQSRQSRALILVTDGESHDDDPIAAAQLAKEAGVVIYTVGIGTPQGAPIVIGGEMMKDEEGQIVVSKLDEQLLQQLAVLTGGSYVRASERSVGLDEILRQIGQMEKKEFSSMAFSEYNDQFHYLLALAFVFLLLEFSMLDWKNRFWTRISIFKA
ncbi:MAG: VWA domain-containing protein [Rikenella sp.]|nr:VWA domain-containing protein [Rikenella sp.]